MLRYRRKKTCFCVLHGFSHGFYTIFLDHINKRRYTIPRRIHQKKKKTQSESQNESRHLSEIMIITYQSFACVCVCVITLGSLDSLSFFFLCTWRHCARLCMHVCVCVLQVQFGRCRSCLRCDEK